METLLAIDVGLSNVKAVVFDSSGRLIARSSVAYRTERPGPDAAEQDPAVWWDALVVAVRALPADARSDVAGVGVTGHMHALVTLDAAGRPTGPSLILGDRRAASDALAITDVVGPEAIYAITGAELDASMPAAKARLLSRTEPDAWRRVAHLLGCKDYLRFRLTGEIATEPVDACATSLFDIRSGQWSDELLHAADVHASMLPAVRAPWDQAGRLRPDVAATLGLRGGLPVAIGAGDDVVVLGFGMLEPGAALEHIGTTGSIMAVADRPTPDPGRRLELYPHVLPDRWVVGGSHTAAGAAIAWAAALLGYPSVEASLDALDAPALPGLAFLPTLAGERFPERVPAARGGWIGLSLEMTRETLMRSVFDGVASSLGSVLTKIDEVVGRQASVRVATADDERWLEVRAGAYGRRLEVSRTAEPTALGLATLVAVATGLHGDVRAAVMAMTGLERTIETDADSGQSRLDPEPVLRGAWVQAADARLRSRAGQVATDATAVRSALVDAGVRT